MKKSKMYLLASVLGLVVTTLAVSSLASAGELGNKFAGRNIDPARLEEMQERHDAMQTALENGDYDAWKGIIDSRPRISDVITEDNFDQFVEMHQLMQDGDREGAQEIAEELGLPGKGKFGKGMRMGHRAGQGECPFADQE